MSPKLLSLLLPVLNDNRVIRTTERLEEALNARNINYEVLIAGPMKKRIETTGRVIHIATSGRKGDNIVEGLKACRGQYVLIMDADYPITEEGLLRLIDYVDRETVVIGHRIYSRKHDSSLSYAYRTLRTRLFRSLVECVIPEFSGLDPQFGVKLLRRDVALKYACMARASRGLAFDLEFLLRMILDGIIPKTLPLLYLHDQDSVVNPLRAGIELACSLPGLHRMRHCHPG